eukprot:CAMPEP_0204876076 /NCGR_PEP_ID=MMETSP1348-20121228/47433_1 /ASSEMBLY_ACC=CAM_ASM_000700 /TAXON_ID=215587 /ORGANISM="Aplanochytrium stocchinoi, Strain GSBS06" /LENGTH=488 /DNA_ID=CAMNT_0052032789 /DNA_START=314 /DNA_END=1780 /DNA_ORIENTATION=+
MTEPPTKGNVLVKTTLGDLDIELWPKESPLACRNFVQLCMESYYDTCVFHRVIAKFMAQTGDPTGTGKGGESIYGGKFKDEFHSRIVFNHPGQVAMASDGNTPDSNGSQFFITLGSCEWLNRKHTIFGKITGNTIYNALKLNEIDTNEDDDRPLEDIRIISTEVLSNPFEDIVPRTSRFELEKQRREAELAEAKRKAKRVAKKNFNLMSFGEEAAEEEREISLRKEDHTMAAQKFESKRKKKKDRKINRERTEPDTSADNKEKINDAKGKHMEKDTEKKHIEASKKSKKDKKKHKKRNKKKEDKTHSEESSKNKNKRKAIDSETLVEEYKALRQKTKELSKDKTQSSRGVSAKQMNLENEADEKLMSEYEKRRYKYVKLNRANRNKESDTLRALEKFKQKLRAAKTTTNTNAGSKKSPKHNKAGGFKGGIGENLTELDKDKAGNDDDDSGWMSAKLTFRRHIDDEVQKGAMNWEMQADDYSVTIRKKS